MCNFKESDLTDDQGIYHEDWAPINREDYYYEYENCVDVNLIIDGKFDRLKELHSKDCPLQSELTGLMAQLGRLDMLQWADQHDIPLVDYIMPLAATGGNLEMVQWLYSMGYKLESTAFAYAAGSGNVKLIDWMHNQPNHNNWNDYVAFSAFTWGAISGNPDMLQWLIDHDVPMSSKAFVYAACYGYLHILEFLHKIKCPADSSLYKQALMKKRPEIIQWCKDNGYDQL